MQNRSITNILHDLLVTSIELAGSIYWELLMVWQRTHELTWSAISLFVVGQYMLVWALSSILVMHGWPLWHICKHFDLNTVGMKNVSFHIMQQCFMARSSFSYQEGLRILGRCLLCSGQPFNICWMRSWIMFSSWVALWICCTCTVVRCGISSGDTYWGCLWNAGKS